MSLSKFLARQKIRKGRTLVVGSRIYSTNTDRRTLYEDAVGLDMQPGKGVDIVHDLEQPLKGHQPFDHIDCCSVLEHVRRPWLLCHNIEELLRHGGSLIVQVPFVWRVHGYPSDYWRFTRNALPVLFPRIRWYERAYLAGDKLVKRSAPTAHIDGMRWLERTELLGFGRKLR